MRCRDCGACELLSVIELDHWAKTHAVPGHFNTGMILGLAEEPVQFVQDCRVRQPLVESGGENARVLSRYGADTFSTGTEYGNTVWLTSAVTIPAERYDLTRCAVQQLASHRSIV